MGNDDIINQTIQATSILNKLEDYFEGLTNELSNCDKKISVSLLYKNMQDVFQKRRKIKQDKALSIYFTQNSGKLNQKSNREMFLQGLKTTQKNLLTEYQNRILTSDEILMLTEGSVKKKRGRPKKMKEGV